MTWMGTPCGRVRTGDGNNMINGHVWHIISDNLGWAALAAANATLIILPHEAMDLSIWAGKMGLMMLTGVLTYWKIRHIRKQFHGNDKGRDEK